MQVTVSYPYTDYTCKEALRQYTLDLPLGRNKLHQQNFFFLIISFIFQFLLAQLNALGE